MQKDILLQQLEQSKFDCFRIMNQITAENAANRLTEKTASVGFIYRHIGETIHLLAQFFGHPTAVQGTTLGKADTGLSYDLLSSKDILEQGYTTLEKLVAETTDHDWLQEIETTWFGKISRIKLYSIALLHTAHHCGQVASAIKKGQHQ